MGAERVSGPFSDHPLYRILCINSYLQLSDVLQSLTVSCLCLTTLRCVFLQSSQLVHPLLSGASQSAVEFAADLGAVAWVLQDDV